MTTKKVQEFTNMEEIDDNNFSPAADWLRNKEKRTNILNKFSDVYWISSIGGIKGDFFYDIPRDECFSFDKSQINEFAKIKAYRDCIPKKEDKDGKNGRKGKKELCYVLNDPYMVERFVDKVPEGETVEYPVFNTFDHPSRRYKGPKVEKLPQVYDDFYSHLFRTTESKEWFINWMASSLRQHNHVFSILVSEEHGTGKGVASHILKALHLKKNVATWSQDEMDRSHFTPNFEGKTLLCVDELKKISNSVYQKLKKCEGLDIDITLKGKDTKNVENTVNLLVTCNEFNAKIPTKDRRFMFPDITDVELGDNKTLLNGKELNDYIHSVLLNPKNISELYRYLFYKELPDGISTNRFETETRENHTSDEAMDWESFFVWFVESLFIKFHQDPHEKYTKYIHQGGIKIPYDILQKVIEVQKKINVGKDKARSAGKNCKTGKITIVSPNKNTKTTIPSLIYKPNDFHEMVNSEIEDEEMFDSVCAKHSEFRDPNKYYLDNNNIPKRKSDTIIERFKDINDEEPLK